MGYKMLCESTWSYKNPTKRTFLVQIGDHYNPMAAHTIDEKGDLIGAPLGSSDEKLQEAGLVEVQGRAIFGHGSAYKIPNFVCPGPGEIFNGPLLQAPKK